MLDLWKLSDACWRSGKKHGIDSFEQPRQQKDGKRALTGSWRKICAAISIDFVTQVLVSAVPLPVQDFIFQPEWATSELLNLEVVEQDDNEAMEKL